MCTLCEPFFSVGPALFGCFLCYVVQWIPPPPDLVNVACDDLFEPIDAFISISCFMIWVEERSMVRALILLYI